MPTTWSAWDSWRRRGPEALLATLAAVVFLGGLGAVELWGKREQRASAEAIDTVDHGHWLVARIQGRPRLEKPPLPRWTVAALMTLTGRRDELMVRLPSAFAALGMVGLAYALGCRIGGRAVGLASGFALTSMGFFISELRQSGNDGPLAFFTTLALYAAWRRLHGAPAPGDLADAPTESQPGARNWTLLMYTALGFGFLCKGPIILLITALTIIPYLACIRQVTVGLRLLVDARGAVVFVLLALSWPLPVVFSDPNAAKIWMMEMGQKAGTAGISHVRTRWPLAVDWPWMTVPWGVFATLALALPFGKDGAAYRSRCWFVWWWAVGNLAMFSVWSVAKPNYYLPCLPAAAVLAGVEWVRLTRAARAMDKGSLARRVLQIHWVALFAGALIAPVVVHRQAPSWFAWSLGAGALLAAAVVASVWLWRNGADAGALAPLVVALAVFVVIAYGVVAPTENSRHGHRALAAALDRALPADEKTLRFFHELDEGLWFYLRDRDLAAVPGSQPAYNDAFTLHEDIRNHRFEWDPAKRDEVRQRLLVEWLSRTDRDSSYVLIRDVVYDRFAPALAGLAEPVFREHDLKRNELVLLRAKRPAVAAAPGAARR